MSYVAPTTAELKARFPEFVDIDNAIVTANIVEANRWVDESWFENDYQPAIMFLAAHYMIAAGLLFDSDAGGGASGPIKSESLGDASISYADRFSGSSGSDEIELMTTSHGARFVAIRRANHPAILFV